MTAAAESPECKAAEAPEVWDWPQMANTLIGVILGGTAVVVSMLFIGAGGLSAAAGATFGVGFVVALLAAALTSATLPLVGARMSAPTRRWVSGVAVGGGILATAVIVPTLTSVVAIGVWGIGEPRPGIAAFVQGLGPDVVPFAGAAGALVAWAYLAPLVLKGLRGQGAGTEL